MPTPSTHEDPESASFTSTCPDEQSPRLPSAWAQYRMPTYEEVLGIQDPNTDTGESRTGTGTGTGAETGAETRRVDAAGSAAETEAAEERQLLAQIENLPSSSPTEEPEVQLVGGMAPTRGPETEDDEDTKQSDTDNDMTEGSAAPTATASPTEPASLGHDGASDTSSVVSSQRRHDAGLAAWEPLGVNQALRRQLYAMSRFGYTPGRMQASSSASVVDSTPTSSTAAPERAEDQQAFDEISWADDQSMYLGCDPTNDRIIPTTPSTYLRPGSRFEGTQQSERQRYDVQVEIKHVDLRESFLCGYLRIQGLTDDHPTLTTYFEGEIIGTKYGFNTKHASWGANDRVDMSHWAKFPAFRQFAKQAKKGNFMIKEHLQKENIFMRWKENFLVPDHRVRTIHGASFEGFYYICFNQVEGVVHGIYFHSKSEKFQQLELKHVNNRGCMSAVEFR